MNMFRKQPIRRKDTFTTSYNPRERLGNFRSLAQSIRNQRDRSDSKDKYNFVKTIHIQKQNSNNYGMNNCIASNVSGSDIEIYREDGSFINEHDFNNQFN
jgi:hypothetical protein